MALKDIDYVIHAAALKQVDTAEYNPFETIKINVVGTQNIIESCLNNNVKMIAYLPIKLFHHLIYMERQSYVLKNW